MPSIMSVILGAFPNFFSSPLFSDTDSLHLRQAAKFLDACQALLAIPKNACDMKPLLSFEHAQFGIELLEKPHLFHPRVHALIYSTMPLFYKNTLCKTTFNLEEYTRFKSFVEKYKRFPSRRGATTDDETACAFFREKMVMWAPAEELAKDFPCDDLDLSSSDEVLFAWPLTS